MAGSGESTGRNLGDGVTQVDRLVLEDAAYPSELTDEQGYLHLANNWVIKRAIEEYNRNVNSDLRSLDSVDRWVENGALVLEPTPRWNSRPPSVPYNARAMAGRRADAIGRLEEKTAQLEEQIKDQMKNHVLPELDSAASTLRSNTRIRQSIAQLDAEIKSLPQELQTLQDHMDGLPTEFLHLTAANPSEVQQALVYFEQLDRAGVRPPFRNFPSPPRGERYATWVETIETRLRIQSSVYTFAKMDAVRSELQHMIDNWVDYYPPVYKEYYRIRSGQSPQEETFDWKSFGRGLTSFLIEEGLWIAAGVVLGAVTGGVGSYLIYAARLARHSSRLGGRLARGFETVVGAVGWYQRLERRVQKAAFEVFENAWKRAQKFDPPHANPSPGGTVSASRQAATQTARRCLTGACR